MRKTELKKSYFDIYMLYTNCELTLEDIGNKHNIPKQRVWQIIRFSKLGGGDYYQGLRLYNRAYTTFVETFKHEEGSKELKSKVVNQMMRGWLKSNQIRLIKTK